VLGFWSLESLTCSSRCSRVHRVNRMLGGSRPPSHRQCCSTASRAAPFEGPGCCFSALFPSSQSRHTSDCWHDPSKSSGMMTSVLLCAHTLRLLLAGIITQTCALSRHPSRGCPRAMSVLKFAFTAATSASLPALTSRFAYAATALRARKVSSSWTPLCTRCAPPPPLLYISRNSQESLVFQDSVASVCRG
jgi:hypothetical protein